MNQSNDTFKKIGFILASLVLLNHCGFDEKTTNFSQTDISVTDNAPFVTEEENTFADNDISPNPLNPTLNPTFLTIHQISESLYDASGTWGVKSFGYRMALRDSYWRADVYQALIHHSTQAYQVVFEERVEDVVQYLLSVQIPESGLFGFPADESNPEFGAKVQEVYNICQDCIQDGLIVRLPKSLLPELYYDHGYTLVTLSNHYQQHPNQVLYDAIEKGGQWLLDKPLSKNINYLSAASKGLAYAYKVTGNLLFLNQAKFFHKEGILPFQNEGGDWEDTHNAQLEYHGFIVSGLIALLANLPFTDPLYNEVNDSLERALAHMKKANLASNPQLSQNRYQEDTWPGTNLLAWHELSQLRNLNPSELSALKKCMQIIETALTSVEEKNGFRLQKTLYSNIFVGLPNIATQASSQSTQ